MDRATLERLTVEQLRQEAARYRLPTTGRKIDLIEAIVSHLEANGPVAELLGSTPDQTEPGVRTGPSRPVNPADQTDVFRQMVNALQGVIRRQDEEREEQRRHFQEQQRQLGRLLEVLTNQRIATVPAMNGASDGDNQGPGPSGLSERTTPSQEAVSTRTTWSTGSAIQALASQFPEFSGREDENVRAWVRRIDKVARVYGVEDGVTLLAASSKLSGSARRWYDIQGGAAVESWTGLREDLVRIFENKEPFYKTMQKIEARKWLMGKETFDEYAIDKLALMHRVDLAEADKIHLLIGGISHSSLRGIALSRDAQTVDVFLESMRRITNGFQDQERKTAATNVLARPKDVACRNCGKKGHGHKECKGETTCFYCKEKGHRRFDCPLLKKKETKGQRLATTAITAAGVTEAQPPVDEVAVVLEGPHQLIIENPLVDVDSLQGKKRKLTALIDTGSPVSFIKFDVYCKFLKSERIRINSTNRVLKNLSDQVLDIVGTVEIQIELRALPGSKFVVFLYVLKNNSFTADLILGRDFLTKEKLTLMLVPSAQGQNNKVELFAHLPLYVEEQDNGLKQIMDNLATDYDHDIAIQLKTLISEIENKEILPVDDEYSVKVRLKD